MQNCTNLPVLAPPAAAPQHCQTQYFCSALIQLPTELFEASAQGDRGRCQALLATCKAHACASGMPLFARYMVHLEAVLDSDVWQYILECKSKELHDWIKTTARTLQTHLPDTCTRICQVQSAAAVVEMPRSTTISGEPAQKFVQSREPCPLNSHP